MNFTNDSLSLFYKNAAIHCFSIHLNRCFLNSCKKQIDWKQFNRCRFNNVEIPVMNKFKDVMRAIWYKRFGILDLITVSEKKFRLNSLMFIHMDVDQRRSSASWRRGSAVYQSAQLNPVRARRVGWIPSRWLNDYSAALQSLHVPAPVWMRWRLRRAYGRH